MPKRERERAAAQGRAMSSDRVLDGEVAGVLASVGRLYPRLRARRDALAAELARVDAALADLATFATANAGSREPRPQARAATPRARAHAPATLEQPVLAALARFSRPIGAGELLAAVRAKGIDASRDAVQIALRRLRERGHVRASGKTRRFSYELASSRRVEEAAPPRAPRRRTAKPAPRRPRRTLADLIIETLNDRGPLASLELSKAITAKHDVSVSGLPRLLWLLRKRGLVAVQGTPGTYRYTVVPST